MIRCLLAQVLMAKEWEVFQHWERSQGDDEKTLWNSRDRFS